MVLLARLDGAGGLLTSASICSFSWASLSPPRSCPVAPLMNALTSGVLSATVSARDAADSAACAAATAAMGSEGAERSLPARKREPSASVAEQRSPGLNASRLRSSCQPAPPSRSRIAMPSASSGRSRASASQASRS